MALDMLQDILGPNQGYYWLAAITPIGRIFTYPREYPNRLPFLEKFTQMFPNDNQYFCVNLTDSKKARQEIHVSASKVVQADLDDKCEPSALLVRPTWLVATSPGKYQAFWVLEDYQKPELVKHVNQRIAAHHGLDACTDYVRLMRLPGTVNHKYPDKPVVEVVEHRPAKFRLSDFDKYPKPMFKYVTDTRISMEPGPEYEKLTEAEKNRVLKYTRQAVQDELEKLAWISTLKPGERYVYRNEKGVVQEFGWERGTMWVVRALVELANAPWSPYTLEQARVDFLTNAPTDAEWTKNDNYFKWQAAIGHCCGTRIRYRAYPQPWGS